MAQDAIIPQRQDFATVGHLYRSIEWGLARLAEKYGEEWLFVGPRRAQATAAHFGWPELVAITDLDSAQRAIEEILEQGEGPRGNWRDAHFGQFVEILDEYEQLREANPGFAPVRPVLAASVRPSERDAEVPLITDPVTSRVTDLFNVGYEILLQIFERYFAHTEETDAQLKTLADATLGLMLRVIKPLGDLITTLPVGAEHPGRTAGPSFELFYETDYLMPHREAAWALLTERLDEAASFCEVVGGDCGRQTAERLTPVLAALREIAQTLAAHLPAASAQARTARTAAGLEPAELAALLDQARDLAQAAARADRDDEVAGGLAGVAEAAYSVVAVASSAGPGGPPAARLVPRLVDSVLRPLADALGRLPVGPDAHRGIDAGAEAPWPPASGQGDTALDPALAGGHRRDVPAGAATWCGWPAGAGRGHRGPAGSGLLTCPASGKGQSAGQPPGPSEPIARVDPGRLQWPIPGDERAAPAQRSGRADPHDTAAGAVPVRRLVDEAVLRRRPRPNRFHRC